jgi:ubiquinone/menaquinone biosynthesis C-methylase UbiE
MSLRKQKKEWEELANIDPLYAIYSDPTRKFGKWDIQEFFLTGEIEIKGVMKYIEKFNYPKNWKKSLDFGCGVGRLTRQLSKNFDDAYGVDISPTMIKKANELNKSYKNCQFVLNDKDSLPFPDDYFDMIYSNIVLMHMPNKKIIKSYISDFLRTLKKDGLVIFQLPSGYSLKYKIQPIRRIYELFRNLGFSPNFLYEKLSLSPIRGEYIVEKEIIDFLGSEGAIVLDVQRKNEKNVKNRIYYLTK